MKEVENFVQDWTNSMDFYESCYRPHEEDVSDIDLDLDVPGIYPRALVYYVELGIHTDDEWALMVDCIPTHPVIAMQIMMSKLRDVSQDLKDINMRIGAQSLFLDEVIGVKP